MEFIQSLIDWYFANLNYFTITLLMAIESTVIPLPSEVVIPFAAWKAANGELNIYLVVFYGTFGALIGSSINYFVARYLGRVLLYKFADSKFGNMLLLTSASIQKTEDYFLKNGNSSTFIGRLLPGIRHLISIPAGLARMKLKNFIIFTTLGALLWNATLAVIGYNFYELKDQYFHELTILLVVLGVLFVAYLGYKAYKISKFNKEKGQSK
jgi:membrane protein DedA with SNARE-associated domain